MRIPTPIQALSAAAALALLAGCSSGSAIAPRPSTPQGHGKVSQMMARPMVAPGLAGRLQLSFIRPIGSRGVQPDFTASAPCTYLSDNFSAAVNVYNNNQTLAGTTVPGLYGYGWGAYATGSKVFLGHNDGTGSIDTFTPCTGHMTGTLTGANTAGSGLNPYSIAGFKNSLGHPQGYSSNWPSNTLQYWATGTGTATLKTEPNMALVYFIDVDGQGRLYAVGFDSTESNMIMDRCNKTITSCTTLVSIPFTGSTGFPGGVQVDVNNEVYLNDQYGTIYSFNCSGATCVPGASFHYSNGSNPLDYTAIAINKNRTKIVGANIYFCSDGCSTGFGGDAQAQSLPLSSATLGASTPGWDNTNVLGVALWKADAP